MGENAQEVLMLRFDRRLRLEFYGARITSDAGFLACRELDGVLGLAEAALIDLRDSRVGMNLQHQVVLLLRQSVYSRLAGHMDTNRCGEAGPGAVAAGSGGAQCPGTARSQHQQWL